jgi:hypothetical protein
MVKTLSVFRLKVLVLRWPNNQSLQNVIAMQSGSQATQMPDGTTPAASAASRLKLTQTSHIKKRSSGNICLGEICVSMHDISIATVGLGSRSLGAAVLL